MEQLEVWYSTKSERIYVYDPASGSIQWENSEGGIQMSVLGLSRSLLKKYTHLKYVGVL